MILYKRADGKFRIPADFLRKSGTNLVSSGETLQWNNNGTWTICYGNNVSPTSGTSANPVQHPFWRYSQNPSFNITESNYFTGHDGEAEYSFSTESSNPAEFGWAPKGHGRYAAGPVGPGSGACTVYLRQGQSNGLSDCILKSKIELNIVSGAKYRTKVTVSSRNPSNPTALTARYFRLVVDAIRGGGSDSYVQLSGFTMTGQNFANLSGGTYTNTVGSSPANEGPANAGDLTSGNINTSTKWLNFTGVGSILRIDFGTAVTVAGYRLATANDADYRDPTSWRIQSSNDGSNWTTIASVSGYGPPARNTEYTADQFSLVPTLLSGFWSNTFSGGANLVPGEAKPANLATSWGPPVNFTRTTSLTDVNQTMPVWDVNTKVYTWDWSVPSGHTFLRPIIKIENKSFLGTEQNLTFADWLVSRVG